MQMDYRKYHDVVLLDSVRDAVWKPSWQSPASISVDYLVLMRILNNPIEHCINLCHKLAPESWQLLFVPSSGTAQVGLGLTPD
jgi:hypothetical protein